MKAAILTRPGGTIEIVDDVEIDDPDAGEVLVRVTHCGVCHSDLTVADSLPGAYPLPAILGHEAAGVIAAVGAGVDALAVGDPVILSMRSPCGVCFQCMRGAPTLCEKAQYGSGADGRPRVRWRGAPVFRGFRLGAFAEYVLVEVGGAVKIAADVPASIAALVGCAVQTGVGAVTNIARMEAGASALIIGTGTVGLCVLQGAILAGATRIIAVDPNPSRREQALAMGATLALDPDDPALLDQIRARTQGRGVDHAFDLVCSDTTPELAVAALRPGGGAVLIGVQAADTRTSLLITPIVTQQKTITGCMLGNCHPHRDFPDFLDLWRAGRLRFDALITRERPLEDINEAMTELRAGIGLRTVLTI